MEQDAGPMPLIWGKRKAEYFFRQDWTTQITLIRFDKFDFACKRKIRSIGIARGERGRLAQGNSATKPSSP
jgi:hypothetical protein